MPKPRAEGCVLGKDEVDCKSLGQLFEVVGSSRRCYNKRASTAYCVRCTSLSLGRCWWRQV
jgi:hypothetical protein